MGSIFLIIMFCSAIHVYTDRFAVMGIIVIRPPWLRCESSQNCRSCSFSGHKQRCWTVLSELRYKVACNPNTFFLNWNQRSAEKVVEGALQCSRRRDILKKVRNKSFDVKARFGATYTASKTKKYLLKNSTIGNQLFFFFFIFSKY